MQVAHAVWTSQKGEGPGLLVWFEDYYLQLESEKFQPVSDIHYGRDKVLNRRFPEPLIHPFAADHQRLSAALNQFRIAPLMKHSLAQVQYLDVLLPSNPAGPLPSPWLNPRHRPQTRMHLTPWRVPAIYLSPTTALKWLLQQKAPSGQHTGVWADSLRFWKDAVNLVLYCLIHGTYMPFVEEEDHQIRTKWKFNANILENQLSALLRKMPTSCESEWFSDGSRRTREAILRDFFDNTIDSLIRNVSGYPVLNKLPLAKANRRKKKQNPLDLLSLPFLKAIYLKQNNFSAPRDVQAAFVALMSNWLRTNSRNVAGQWKVCFSLITPEIGEASIDDMDPRLKIWRLAFSLQHTREPGQHIWAQDIWENLVPTVLNTGETLAEILLKGLGRATKHFENLRSALEYPFPTYIDLTTDEAHRFLSLQAPHLQQAGCIVEYPPWWNRNVKSLKTKLQLDGSAFEGTSMLGFNTMVSFHWKASVGNTDLSQSAFEKLVKNKLAIVPINGQWVEIQSDDLLQTVSFFEEKQAAGEMRLMDAMQMGLESDQLKTAMDEVNFDYKGWMTQLFNSDQSEVKDVEQPKKLKGKLRPYQLRGLSWLVFHHHLGFGACLADDMGLGKTIQLLALLLAEREWKKAKLGPTLLVCPMSVVGNWHREAQKFGPSLKVMIHHGSDRLSQSGFLRACQHYDLIITTYSLVARDRETLSAKEWHRIALDEAQNIKNPTAQQTLAIRNLKAKHRLALTGTPVENKLSELWSIMDFLNPGYLGTLKDFQTRFAIPIERQNSAEKVKLLRHLTQPFILRRLKTDTRIIQDLPEKIEMKVYCDLTEEQAAMYQAYVQAQLKEIEEAEGIKRNQLVLTTLMKLKQICNHPAHFLKDSSAMDERSGKLMRLTEMMDEALDEGDKSLIFTQFTEMGELLAHYLERTFKQPVLFMHGGVTQPKRQAMVDSFQDPKGPKLFVLTVKTGGTGLNLTSATHVFHYDRWWNPAVENQATDRAFRIGQKRNVQVHKLISIGTLEDRIDLMIEKKRELAENIVGSDEAWLSNLSTDALREILTLSVDKGDPFNGA
ncbi:MAG: DEAD/DEAH box helicase [Acidobacteria bacterium]|nr:DEAD/DEAH box helicase [Acidobacteriota bacterium]